GADPGAGRPPLAVLAASGRSGVSTAGGAHGVGAGGHYPPPRHLLARGLVARRPRGAAGGRGERDRHGGGDRPGRSPDGPVDGGGRRPRGGRPGRVGSTAATLSARVGRRRAEECAEREGVAGATVHRSSEAYGGSHVADDGSPVRTQEGDGRARGRPPRS